MEEEPMEDLIQMISIMISNKYFWGRQGAMDELNQVMEDEDQVKTLLNYLESEVPTLYKQFGGVSEPKKIVEVPKTQK